MIDDNKTELEERKDLLYLGSLFLGTFFLFFAVYYKLDYYLVFTVTVLTWISPALYKSKNRPWITFASFLIAFTSLILDYFSWLSRFDGFVFFSFFMLLGFVVLSNTSYSTSESLEDNLI